MMPLDFEKCDGTEMSANSCLWPWLIRHTDCVGSRFSVKNKWSHAGSRRARQRVHFWASPRVLCRIPLPHTRRTNQYKTIYRGVSGWDKGFRCGLDEHNAHNIVTETGRQSARTIRRLPRNQSTDVKGLPWDGHGLVRRGRPPTVTLVAPPMADAGETLRSGG